MNTGRSMKRQKQTLAILLSIISLATIGIVLSKGFMANRPKELKKESLTNVLGEQLTNLKITPPVLSDIQDFVQTTLENTLTNTKEILSQKTVEVEQRILTNVQKEVINLSENQITALKTQICRDLGVLPSLTPSPAH